MSVPSPSTLWRRYVLEPIARGDHSPPLPPGRVSADARVIIVYAVGALVLVAMYYGALNPVNQDAMGDAVIGLAKDLSPSLGKTLGEYRELVRVLTWIAGAFAFYFALPALVVKVVFGHRLADYGLRLEGFVRHLPTYIVLFLPVAGLVFLVSGSAEFQSKYPLYHQAKGLGDMLIWDLGYGIQFFSLEFFFRGFLVHGVRDRLGSAAVFAMIMPYVMIHFSKPLYETLGAVLAGSVLGILSLRTGSIAGGVFIHTAVAWTMDAAALAHRANPWSP
ncbi:MAG: CPBP family intramembrane glutamic endopeptidase [Myxococcota bacterium]